MPAALHPPDTTALSKDEILAATKVKNKIWSGGVSGFVYGSVGGYIFHSISRAVHKRFEKTKGKIQTSEINNLIKFNRNTALFSVMAGGALGSFLYSSIAGKNNIHLLKEIQGSPYQKNMDQVKSKDLDAEEREHRRLSRRNNIKQRFEEGHGISDSHGGQWMLDDDLPTERKRRLISRRRTVKQRIEEGQGLSDSHGGQWVDSDSQH